MTFSRFPCKERSGHGKCLTPLMHAWKIWKARVSRMQMRSFYCLCRQASLCGIQLAGEALAEDPIFGHWSRRCRLKQKHLGSENPSSDSDSPIIVALWSGDSRDWVALTVQSVWVWIQQMKGQLSHQATSFLVAVGTAGPSVAWFFHVTWEFIPESLNWRLFFQPSLWFYKPFRMRGRSHFCVQWLR